MRHALCGHFSRAQLIMYDACDEAEVRAPLGRFFRKRLDARRNTKPKKSDDQLRVCQPFDERKFHFGKIQNDRERLVRLAFGSAASRYDVLTARGARQNASAPIGVHTPPRLTSRARPRVRTPPSLRPIVPAEQVPALPEAHAPRRPQPRAAADECGASERHHAAAAGLHLLRILQ